MSDGPAEKLECVLKERTLSAALIVVAAAVIRETGCDPDLALNVAEEASHESHGTLITVDSAIAVLDRAVELAEIH